MSFSQAQRLVPFFSRRCNVARAAVQLGELRGECGFIVEAAHVEDERVVLNPADHRNG